MRGGGCGRARRHPRAPYHDPPSAPTARARIPRRLAVVYVARVASTVAVAPSQVRLLLLAASHLANKTHEDRAIAIKDVRRGARATATQRALFIHFPSPSHATARPRSG